MNAQPFKIIHRFNKEASLLDQGYSDERECAFPIEEALEGFDMEVLSTLLLQTSEEEPTPKGISRKTIFHCGGRNISDVDRLDKHLDIIVFSLGSIYKLGLSPQEAMKALGIVAEKNLEKLHAGQDAEGKQQKPENFVGPEAQLQKILDERK